MELGIWLDLLARMKNYYLGLLLICRARSCVIPLLIFIKVEVTLCTIGALKALGVGLLLDLWLLLRVFHR